MMDTLLENASYFPSLETYLAKTFKMCCSLLFKEEARIEETNGRANESTNERSNGWMERWMDELI